MVCDFRGIYSLLGLSGLLIILFSCVCVTKVWHDTLCCSNASLIKRAKHPFFFAVILFFLLQPRFVINPNTQTSQSSVADLDPQQTLLTSHIRAHIHTLRDMGLCGHRHVEKRLGQLMIITHIPILNFFFLCLQPKCFFLTHLL